MKKIILTIATVSTLMVSCKKDQLQPLSPTPIPTDTTTVDTTVVDTTIYELTFVYNCPADTIPTDSNGVAIP